MPEMAPFICEAVHISKRHQVIAKRTGFFRKVRWTPDMRQVAMRESYSYKRPRNRSSHEAVSAEAQCGI
jgi:hypothetical protein